MFVRAVRYNYVKCILVDETEGNIDSFYSPLWLLLHLSVVYWYWLGCIGYVVMIALFYVGLFYNGTGGSLTCYDITKEFIECADPTGCGLGSNSLSWDFQVHKLTNEICPSTSAAGIWFVCRLASIRGRLVV